MSKTKRKLLAELLILLVGSMFIGWLIGTAQHFIAFGVGSKGELFNGEGLAFAAFEGGLVGAFVAVPTGLIVYYLILSSRVRPREVIVILSIALIGGCMAAAIIPIASAIATPVLTFVAALSLRLR